MHMREVTIAYGMTETSPVSYADLHATIRSSGASPPSAASIRTSRSRSSTPTAASCRAATSGELCTRGYSVMLGYWGDEERTAEAIDRAGWMHTGDLATIDEDGYCNIVGRIKDMVIRGGENVYPREIEEFLFRHPKIEAVQVVGVPDAKYGEELCAWVKLKPGASRQRRGRAELLPGPDRALQDPALHQVRRRLPDDRHRQGAEVHHARGDDQGARTQRAEDGLTAGRWPRPGWRPPFASMAARMTRPRLDKSYGLRRTA